MTQEKDYYTNPEHPEKFQIKTPLPSEQTIFTTRSERRQRIRPPLEALEGTYGLETILNEIVVGEVLSKRPGEVHLVIAIGEAGAGKGTLMEQGGMLLQSSESLQLGLEHNNSELELAYLSFSKAAEDAKKRGIIPENAERANYTREQYNAISNHATKAIWTTIANQEENKYKRFDGTISDKPITRIIIMEATAITNPIPENANRNVGGSTVRSLMRYDNKTIFAVTTNDSIQQKAIEARNMLLNDSNISANVVLGQFNITVDKPITADELSKTMSTTSAIIRGKQEVNTSMTHYREEINKFLEGSRKETLPEYNEELLESDPELRRRVQEGYYRFLIALWGGEENYNSFIIHPEFIQDKTVHYYQEMYDKPSPFDIVYEDEKTEDLNIH